MIGCSSWRTKPRISAGCPPRISEPLDSLDVDVKGMRLVVVRLVTLTRMFVVPVGAWLLALIHCCHYRPHQVRVHPHL
jgi:hypothetical protein